MAHREITVSDYRACQDNVNPTNGVMCRKDIHPVITGNTKCNFNALDRQDHPINCITHVEAMTFAQWCSSNAMLASRRSVLPTEAQFEYVARQRGQAFNYANDNHTPVCTETHFSSTAAGCGTGLTTKPCTKGVNNTQGFPLYAEEIENFFSQTDDSICDISGNVSEWTMDTYLAPYSTLATYLDGTAYNGTSRQNLTKTIRGGSWNSTVASQMLTTYARASASTITRSTEVGFRLACSITSAALGQPSYGCYTECGDGVVNGVEECDDANDNEDDGCTSQCRFEACGDGFVQNGEDCDDGFENGKITSNCDTYCNLK